MPIEQLVILALFQGITEFLPVSASAHLILVPSLTGEADRDPLLNVAAHVGTLGAVLLYLWRDVVAMLVGLARGLLGRFDPGLRLALQLVLATLPLVAAGYTLSREFGGPPLSVEIIGWTTLGFGVLLWIADRAGMTVRRVEHMGYGTALFVGLAQVLALVPGTSRAGIDATAARLLGFERTEAARLSMLMGIPAIVAATTLAGFDLHEAGGGTRLTFDAIVTGALSMVAALIAIAAMMRWLRRASFLPFVLYRILLGGGLLAWVYLG